MQIQKFLADDPIAQKWTAQTRQTYIAFSKRLANHHPLTVKVGKGGLSYYKATPSGKVFVCHFNAAPRAQNPELGFADFRLAALRDRLDLEAALQGFQKAASADMRLQVNQQWCSLHFPLSKSDKVADLFRKQIVSKVK